MAGYVHFMIGSLPSAAMDWRGTRVRVDRDRGVRISSGIRSTGFSDQERLAHSPAATRGFRQVDTATSTGGIVAIHVAAK